jgi:hypothetical protein
MNLLRRRRTVAAAAVSLLLTASAGIAGTGPAHAASTYIWGPGCPYDNSTQAVWDLDYGSTGGSWSSLSYGDWTGAGFFVGNCSGTTIYAWNTAASQYQWTIDPIEDVGARCTIDAYIPTANAGAYAVRYDFWWLDYSGVWHWLAWPGHDIDQEALSSWNQIMYGFTMPSAAEFKVTMHVDTAQDSQNRYLGAGDMELQCG